MKLSHDEQKIDNDNVKILAKEIESWKDFRYALREENASLFNEILSECRQGKDYIRAANFRGENYSAESLFTFLVLQQQKMTTEIFEIVSCLCFH